MCIGNIFHSSKGLSCVPCDTITAPLSLSHQYHQASPYTGECWISACFEGVCFCEYNGAITRLWTHQGLRPNRKMRPRMAAVIYIGQPSSEMSLLLNSTLRALVDCQQTLYHSLSVLSMPIFAQNFACRNWVWIVLLSCVCVVCIPFVSCFCSVRVQAPGILCVRACAAHLFSQSTKHTYETALHSL